MDDESFKKKINEAKYQEAKSNADKAAADATRSQHGVWHDGVKTTLAIATFGPSAIALYLKSKEK